MGEDRNKWADLANAAYSKTAEAYELAEQLEQAAQNTPDIDQARKIAADLNRMTGEISGLRHKLINSEE